MTEWIKKDDHIYPENNPGFKIYDEDDVKKPALWIHQTINPETDRDAAINMKIRRTGGRPQNCLFLAYHVDAEHTGGFDIGMTSLVEADNLQGGSIFSLWLVAAGPAGEDTHGGIIGTEINVLERRRDEGLKYRRREGNFSVGMQIIPENSLNVGDKPGTQRGYNSSFGLVFTHSAPAHNGADWERARTHVPICIEPGATAQDGICLLIQGAEHELNEPDTPSLIGKFMSNFQKGLCFKDAIFDEDDIAIQFKQEHKVLWGSSFISGVEGVSNGLMLGTDHLYWSNTDRSMYRQGNAIWYRWKEDGKWKYQHIAGPK